MDSVSTVPGINDNYSVQLPYWKSPCKWRISALSLTISYALRSWMRKSSVWSAPPAVLCAMLRDDDTEKRSPEFFPPVAALGYALAEMERPVMQGTWTPTRKKTPRNLRYGR